MLPAGTYFFPANLPHYITRWNVAAASEVRFSLTVIRGTAGVSLRPVFDAELAVLQSGVWAYFSSGISATSSGFFVTEWEPMNEDAVFIGEVYVGVVVEVSEEIDERDLVLGLAEVQIR